MNERIVIDTNIILYALNDADLAKKTTALNIIRRYPILSAQSFTEVINVCRRKWKYDKNRQISVGEFLLIVCLLSGDDRGAADHLRAGN